MNINYPSISQFQQLVELKDYRPATKLFRLFALFAAVSMRQRAGAHYNAP